jgi:hypothetical protein
MAMRRLMPFVLAALPALIPASCGSIDDSSSSAPTRALFTVPASLDALSETHWYDVPWPSDLRRDPDGSIRVTGFYNPHQTIILDTYIKNAKGLLDGFSPASLGYFRFTGDIDPLTLPASPPATLDPGASVQIVDVDPQSPERGKRKLAQTFWQKDEGVYWLKDTLAVGPALGWPLRPKTKYAIVVTKKVLTAEGKPLAPSSDLEEILGVRPPTARTQAAHDLFAPSIAELGAAGIAASDIAHFTGFTTNDPTAELFAIADDVRANFPAPTAPLAMWTAKEQTSSYDVYEGMYGPSPSYQAGTIPFKQDGDGGSFVFEAGKPKVQGQFNLRFALVVPNATRCPMPAGGYPVTLYAHGTGGDYRSFIDDGTAQSLAERCVASHGIDQIFHGTRPGSPPADDPNRTGDIELTFFNLNNILAARTNGRQGAIDVVQQARLFTASHMKVPASVSRTAAEVSFDDSKMTFFGHSQGGLNGPLFLAADDQTRGGVLSGSGSVIIVALLEKTKPTPSVAAAVRTILQLTHPEDQGELNLFHPVMNLAQTLVDATDPVHYVGYLAQHPRSRFAAKSIYQTEGIAADGTGDSYAPPHGIELGAVATGLPRMLPGIREVTEATWGGLGGVSIPPEGLSGNLAGGQATGVLAQFAPAAGHDGHFVVFDVPSARAQAAQFCRNLSDDPKGRVPPL